MTKSSVLFFDYWPGIDYLHASGHGAGSSLFKLAALNDASKHSEVQLLTSEAKKQLLNSAPSIKKIITDIDNLNLENFAKVISLGISEDQVPKVLKDHPGFIPFKNSDRKRYKQEAHTTFWRKFCADSLGYTIPTSRPEVSLQVDEPSLNEAKKILWKNCKKVAIPIQSISRLKDYAQWKTVIGLLLKSDPSLQVILLGDCPQNTISGDNILDLCGKTDIQLLKAVISQVDVLTGVDGLATNIAIALGTPSLILFTMISPENVIPEIDSDKIKTLTAHGCPYQFCYNDLTNYREGECSYLQENISQTPKCLEFSPQTITHETIKLMQKFNDVNK